MSSFRAAFRVILGFCFAAVVSAEVVRDQPANSYEISELTDGTTGAARFDWPWGIAVGADGSAYIADLNNLVVRKLSPDGDVSTIAGAFDQRGDLDGLGSSARFRRPAGLTLDRAGNIYVTDEYASTIRKISPAGQVTTIAGTPGQSGFVDGNGLAARFRAPLGIAADAQGNLFVADTSNHVIRKVTPDGTVTTLAGSPGTPGSADGVGPVAAFNYPTGIAVDLAGTLWIADKLNNTIRKIAPDGMVTTAAGQAGESGNTDGTGAAARFKWPTALAVGGDGNIYVTDAGSYVVRRIRVDGVVETVTTGKRGAWDGPAAMSKFGVMSGIAVTPAGTFLITDSSNHTIRSMTVSGTTDTVAGVVAFRGAVDGQGAAYPLAYGQSVTTDAAGNVYFSDGGRNIVQKITPARELSTIAGRVHHVGATNGPGTLATFDLPTSIAMDADGTVYVADYGNSLVRKISKDGVVSTLAGNLNKTGIHDGVGEGATFIYPDNVVVDRAGNVYVADYGPGLGATTVIRKIDPNAVVTTFAGSYGSPIYGLIDGIGTAAKFGTGGGLAIDRAGNLYLSEWGDNLIRKITPDRVVTTMRNAQGQLPECHHPVALAIDERGVLIVSVNDGSLLRLISPSCVSTVLTNHATGKAAQAGRILGLAVDPNGVVYGIQNHGTDTREVVQRLTPVRNSTELPVVASGPLSPGETGQIKQAGERQVFNVLASSTSDFGYQWLKDGEAIPGATKSEFVLENCQLSDAGRYSARITNTAGAVTSPEGQIEVEKSPFTGTYFGSFTSGGNWAMTVQVDGAFQMIGHVPSRHAIVSAEGRVYPSRIFSATAPVYVDGTGASAVSYVKISGDFAPDRSWVAINLIRFDGGSTVSGRGAPDADSGPFASLAGYHGAQAIGAAGGTAQMIVGASGRNLFTALAGKVVDAAAGTMDTSGRMAASTMTGRDLAVRFGPKDGALTATLTRVSPAMAWDFSAIGSNTIAARDLVNISCRAQSGAGNNVVIGGFVVGGTGAKKVLIRAIGPSLVSSGIRSGDLLSDPAFELHDALQGNQVVLENDNWDQNGHGDELLAAGSSLGATPLDTEDRNSAGALVALNPGIYTFVIRGKGNAPGVVLAEVYDADPANTSARLMNISARARVETNDSVAIGGFVISGNAPKRVLVRAVGPTLTSQGLMAAEILTDPQLVVHAALEGNRIIGSNDNWSDNDIPTEITETAARVGATPLAISDETSSAMVLTLRPGVYTFVVRGKGETSGIALLEIYDAD